MPVGDEHHVGQHRDHPDAAGAVVAEVHVAVAAARDAGLAAHVLAEDRRRLRRRARGARRGRGAGRRGGRPPPSPRSRRPRRPPGRSRRRRTRAPCPGGRGSSRAPRSARMSSIARSRPTRSSGVRCADGLSGRVCWDRSERPCCWSPSSPFVLGGRGRDLRLTISTSRRDLRARCQPSSAEGTGYVRWLTWTSRHEGARRRRLRRLRWRLRGAWLWPTFVVVTLLEMALLHWLPIAGRGQPAGSPALLLAGCLNLIAVALLGGLGGIAAAPPAAATCRRSSPTTTPASAALAVVGAGVPRRRARAPPRARRRRAGVRASSRWPCGCGSTPTATTSRARTSTPPTRVQVDRDLYRTCVPRPDPKRWLCLDRRHVAARRRASSATRAASRTRSQNPRGVFR